MKSYLSIKHPYLLVLASVLTLVVGTASGETGATDRVTVSWAPDSQLTEIKQNPSHHGWLRPNEWKRQLAKSLRRDAQRVLPAGDRLHVKITDIKLAGDFEPWRGPNSQDIRIIKDIYPPRMDLHFTLTDADGKVLREGNRKLRDLAFLQHPIGPFSSTDPLRYDKRLIRDWVQREFKHQKS